MERRHLGLRWYGLGGSVCFLLMVAISVTLLVILTRNKSLHDFPSIKDVGKAHLEHSRHSLFENFNPFSSPELIKNNLWLRYANFTTTSLTNYSCTFCMAARPHLMVTPVPDTSETCASDPHFPSTNYSCKFLCDIYYTNSDTSSKIPKVCGDFLPSSDFTRPPTGFEPPEDVVIPSELNVTDCFISPHGTTDVGTVKANCKYLWDVRKRHHCTTDDALLYQTDYLVTVNITKDCMNCNRSEWVAKRPAVTPLRNPDQRVADVWWLCGGAKLRPVLPQTWKGTCIRVRLIQQVMLDPQVQSQMSSSQRRMKRSMHTSEPEPKVYIDAIGVPRGVPDQYKARNEIFAGLTSWIPLFGYPVETNKNTAWINYIYYSQQRFANSTTDALKALGEQLHATSLMTWQNRLALDMLLAEKGGVCAMFGDACCTFIPNNTAADGSFTKALNELRTLADELKENSGTDSFFMFDWFAKILGKWKALLLSISAVVVGALVLFTLCGCCIIPCIRSLVVRTVDKCAPN